MLHSHHHRRCRRSRAFGRGRCRRYASATPSAYIAMMMMPMMSKQTMAKIYSTEEDEADMMLVIMVQFASASLNILIL
jgi:hypothetical protein